MSRSRPGDIVGFLAAAGIRTWVRRTGRRVPKESAPWLLCPMGTPGRIGAEFYDYLARRERLEIRPEPDAGLLPDFDALRGGRFDPAAVHPAVRNFYEHTACYRLEAWSEAGPWTRFFLWALTRFVSRRMDQLNFPVSSLELAGGMTSAVLPMLDPASGRRVYTGWLRRLAVDDRVIYTGLYSVGRPGAYPDPCVKVSFPLPHGSATVFLRPEALPDGSFRLISSGARFGDPGFYRMVETDDRTWKVRYLRTLRETFHVYVDRQWILRTEHVVRFLGFTVLRLLYKWIGCGRARWPQTFPHTPVGRIMSEKSFLSAWCRGFGVLFLFTATGLTFWSLSLRDSTEKVMPIFLAALCAIGGATLNFLGTAFSRIHQLERRVRELERQQQDSIEKKGAA